MSHSAWWLIVDSLCVYRLTVLIVDDEIFRPFREWVGKRGHPINKVREWWLFLVTCPWCVSIWIAAAVVALTAHAPDFWQYPAAGLTFSAVAGFLSERTDH